MSARPTAVGAGGTLDELKNQILDLALDRAFLTDPLPTDAAAFKARVDEGRGRLTLIANEIARQAGVILTEYAARPASSRTASRPPTWRPTCSSSCSAWCPTPS